MIGQTQPVHGRGNIAVVTGVDEARCNLFGLGVVPHHEEGNVKYAYPYAQDGEDVFGLGDEGCTCPPINIKNSSMVGLGSLVAWKGLGFRGKAGTLVRLAAGAVAVIGLWDIVQGFQRRAATVPQPTVPVPAPVPQTQLPLMGLGITPWYPDEPKYGYSRHFMDTLTNRYYRASGLRPPSYMR